MAIIFIKGQDLFYNGGNSPESLQAYNPALGGYIIQIEITSNTQVSSTQTSCLLDTWGLMERSFALSGSTGSPSKYKLNRNLGATNRSCQTIQVTQVLINYIEGSTAQLVKHKALNLVDVGSSPMMGVTSYDVLFKEVYIKSQLNIILLSRPLEATRCC